MHQIKTSGSTRRHLSLMQLKVFPEQCCNLGPIHTEHWQLRMRHRAGYHRSLMVVFTIGNDIKEEEKSLCANRL